MNALVQLLTRLHGAQKMSGTRAGMEINRAIDAYLNGAWRDLDELEDILQHADELERENEELRRRLRAAGLNDKIEEKEVEAA